MSLSFSQSTYTQVAPGYKAAYNTGYFTGSSSGNNVDILEVFAVKLSKKGKYD